MCDKMAETDLSIFFIFSFLSLFFGIGRDILSALCCSLFFHSMLSSSIVLVTGASAGIGEACARVFSAAGARCILMARRSERLSELAASLPTPSRVVCCDVRNRTHVHQAISSLEPEWSAIDFLINNAGLSRGLAALQDGNEDDWDEMIDTNVKGLLYVTKSLLPDMIQRGNGMIINIASVAGRQVYPKGNVYCASKHAVRALSEGLQYDVLGTGVRVCNIDPGMVETEFSLVRFKGDAERAQQTYKGLRPLTALDVAETALFCATRPPHVSIQDILLMPADQASVHLAHRRTE